MASATLTRPRPGQPEAGPPPAPVPWPWLVLAGLVIGTMVGFFVRPTYPNYDSYYSLLWGREVLHGTLPSFDAYRAPTEHPLAIAFGALLALVGDDADRVMVAATFASFVVLAAGHVPARRGRRFTPIVGLVAAALLCTRFDFPFLAARAYIDIPYLALIVWAGALEAGRRRRGTPVFVLLAAAGLLRPEAWLLSGAVLPLDALAPRRGRSGSSTRRWPRSARSCGPRGLDRHRRPAVLAHLTTGLAEELGRTRGAVGDPAALPGTCGNPTRVPVFFAGLLGLVMAIVLVPLRAVCRSLLFVVGHRGRSCSSGSPGCR